MYKKRKVIKFWKLPPVLVICLKRFGYDKKIKNSTYYIEIGGGETLPNSKSLGSGQSIISYELGFKKKVNDKFSFKIQYEGKNYTDTYLDHELEFETKYRF